MLHLGVSYYGETKKNMVIIISDGLKAAIVIFFIFLYIFNLLLHSTVYFLHHLRNKKIECVVGDHLLLQLTK